MDMRSRFRGALLGLAAGDALGTTLEFKPPGSFEPVADIVGGGPFGLRAGQWTDDTSMALCLAESLVERRGFDAVAAGSFKRRQPPDVRGGGYVVDSLEAALWAFHRGADFREGALLAVNLGDDADTTGAVYGQLAGALYGEEGIPAGWRARLACADLITGLADGVLELAGAG